jgi:hypothetical protein
MAPTIAEFLAKDSSLTVFFAAAERINGVEVDPTILSIILPKMFPPHRLQMIHRLQM